MIKYLKLLAKYRSQVITAIPLVCVNIVAISGQYGYLSDHLHWITAGLLVFAAALESIGLFLAYMAHKALLSLDSSIRLRILAVMYGGIAGYMNGTHYAIHRDWGFISYATALMSVSSPILWGIYSRRVSRDELISRDLIEPGAVRLGATRWFWHPYMSLMVQRDASWSGERNARRAIADWEGKRPAVQSAPVISRPVITRPVVIPRAIIPVKPAVAITAPVVTPSPAPVAPVTAAPVAPVAPSPVAPANVTPTVTPVAQQSVATQHQSNSATIRAAIAALGSNASVADIAAWSAERGVTVNAATVRSVRSRDAKAAATQQRNTLRAVPAPGNGG